MLEAQSVSMSPVEPARDPLDARARVGAREGGKGTLCGSMVFVDTLRFSIEGRPLDGSSISCSVYAYLSLAFN